MSNNESDLFVRCSRCTHQKADHDRNANKDKMKCLVGNCSCKSFAPDRKYYRSSRK
ncbi:MAG TPA: hypothetical protein VE378_03465 [Nitrososphaeraceae archaeon]|jgi:hypothetical protein|nr:hypothetical protein [Nitrososphaeraceae archaeon]